MFWPFCFARALELQWELCYAGSCPWRASHRAPLCCLPWGHGAGALEQSSSGAGSSECYSINQKKVAFHMGKGRAGRAKPWSWNTALRRARECLILLRRNLCKHQELAEELGAAWGGALAGWEAPGAPLPPFPKARGARGREQRVAHGMCRARGTRTTCSFSFPVALRASGWVQSQHIFWCLQSRCIW